MPKFSIALIYLMRCRMGDELNIRNNNMLSTWVQYCFFSTELTNEGQTLFLCIDVTDQGLMPKGLILHISQVYMQLGICDHKV